MFFPSCITFLTEPAMDLTAQMIIISKATHDATLHICKFKNALENWDIWKRSGILQVWTAKAIINDFA